MRGSHRSAENRIFDEGGRSVERSNVGVRMGNAGNGAGPSAPPEKLAVAFDRLAAGADAGDVISACLLSRGLSRCREIETAKIDASERIDEAARAESGSDQEYQLLKVIETLDSEVKRYAPLCEGLSSLQLEQAGERMYQAARLGDADAMTDFALRSGPPRKGQGKEGPLAYLYRTHAIEMLERSASAGNVNAMRALYEVHLSGRLPNGSVYNDGAADLLAAVALGGALLEAGVLEEAEADRTKASLARILTPGMMDSSRYRYLRNKYSGWTDRLIIRNAESRKDEHDISDCISKSTRSNA